MHSVAVFLDGTEIDVPLNYADYYFLEALNESVTLKKAHTKLYRQTQKYFLPFFGRNATAGIGYFNS